MHVFMRTRTNTLCAVLTNRPAGVARRAFCSTAHGTSSTSLPHAVIACAYVHWNNVNTQEHDVTTCLCKIVKQEVRTRTNTLSSVVAERPSSLTKRAFRGTVNMTARASLRNAVIAYAGIRFEIATYKSTKYKSVH